MGEAKATHSRDPRKINLGGETCKALELFNHCTLLYAGPAINVAAVVLTTLVLGFELGAARAVFAIISAMVIGLIMAAVFGSTTGAGGKVAAEAQDSEKRTRYAVAIILLTLPFIILGGLEMGLLAKAIVLGLVLMGILLIAVFRMPRDDLNLWMS